MGTYAVVLAGGVGSRMKLNTPKQFLKLAGRAVLEHTLDNLERTRLFDGIVIVMHRESFEETKDSVPVSRYQTPITIVPGGSTRNESSIEGLKAVYASGGSDSDKVLIHDAVRPFVNLAMLNRVIDGLDSEDAVDTAIPTADTIVRVNDDMYIEEVPRRDVLYRGQTPQGFKLGVIKKAFDAAVADGRVNFPDDIKEIHA